MATRCIAEKVGKKHVSLWGGDYLLATQFVMNDGLDGKKKDWPRASIIVIDRGNSIDG